MKHNKLIINVGHRFVWAWLHCCASNYFRQGRSEHPVQDWPSMMFGLFFMDFPVLPFNQTCIARQSPIEFHDFPWLFQLKYQIYHAISLVLYMFPWFPHVARGFLSQPSFGHSLRSLRPWNGTWQSWHHVVPNNPNRWLSWQLASLGFKALLVNWLIKHFFTGRQQGLPVR